MLILQAHHFLEAVMKTNGRHGAPTEHLEPLNDAEVTTLGKVCSFVIGGHF